MCVSQAVKFEDEASRMYERDRTSFSTEDELKNVPINVISKLSVDTLWPDTTHINVVRVV